MHPDTVTTPLALVGMFAFVAFSFVLFGAPEMERQAKINQENIHVVSK